MQAIARCTARPNDRGHIVLHRRAAGRLAKFPSAFPWATTAGLAESAFDSPDSEHAESTTASAGVRSAAKTGCRSSSRAFGGSSLMRALPLASSHTRLVARRPDRRRPVKAAAAMRVRAARALTGRRRSGKGSPSAHGPDCCSALHHWPRDRSQAARIPSRSIDALRDSRALLSLCDRRWLG